jgi:cell wall-associated NlpC family hydrolase
MTTTRMSASPRSTRRLQRGAFAFLAASGVLLTPAVAQANTGAPPPAVATIAAAPAPTPASQTAVNTALAQLGKPYVWAAAGPNSFDCSGLALYAWGAAGVRLPHSSSMQSTMGAPVSRADLQPGDLVFFYTPVSHVGIYIGNNQVVHAPTEGDVVKVTDIDAMGGYNSARRVG